MTTATHPGTEPRTAVQVVLDTSALVSDPTGIFDAYPGTDLVLPLTVLEELDGLKKRLDPVGVSARHVLRTLERFRVEAGGDLRHPFPVNDRNTTIRVELNGVQNATLSEFGLDAAKPDNRIIGVGLSQKNEHGRAVVVSNDAAFRVKAAALGLDTKEHDTTRHASFDQRPVGWSDFDVSADAIDAAYEQRPHPELAQVTDALAINQFAVLKAGSQSALLRRTATGLDPLRQDREAWGLRAKNKEQRFALDLLLDPDVPVVAIDGQAGTGKTILAVAAGLEQVVETQRYKRVCVYRPVVPVGKTELGFLPGDLDDKTSPYMQAITDAMYALSERRSEVDARNVLDELKAHGQLTMESVAHLRGRTLHDSFVIIDEAQNLEGTVAKTLLTRLGEHSKIVFTGDTSQIDAAFLSESNNSLAALVAAFTGQECFGQIRLTKGERSPIAELAAQLL